jgi:hypothetical protein
MRSLALLAFAALLPFSAANAAVVDQTADMLDLPARTTVLGTATLRREDNLLRIRISTTGLIEGRAYVVIAFLFQDPSFCTGDPCDFIGDSAALGGNPAVNATAILLTAGQAYAGSGGVLEFAGKIEKGTAGLIGHQVLEGQGFYNMFGGDVQVLIRDAGVIGANGVDVYDQLTDYNAGCPSCSPKQIATFNAN